MEDIKITYKMKKGKLYFYLDGDTKGIKTADFAKMLNRSVSSLIRQYRVHYHEFEKFATWANDILWIKENELNIVTHPFKLNDGSRYCAQMLSEQLKCNISTAQNRCRKYKHGDISEKELFAPIKKLKHGHKNGHKTHSLLGNIKMGPRKKKNDIPSGTEFDRKFAGAYSGSPQVFLANNNVSRY